MARYYSASSASFWSPDPGSLSTANPTSPTSWNRYGYGDGDPINHRDPTGRIVVACDDPDATSIYDASCEEVGNGEEGGGSFCGGNAFDPTPDPSCYAYVPPPLVTDPTCYEELFTRPIIGLPGQLGATHQYVVMYDSNGNEWTIEGEPQHVQTFNWGTLQASVIENGYGPNDNPSKDKPVGGKNVIPCSQVNTDVAIAKGFTTDAQFSNSCLDRSIRYLRTGDLRRKRAVSRLPPSATSSGASFFGLAASVGPCYSELGVSRLVFSGVPRAAGPVDSDGGRRGSCGGRLCACILVRLALGRRV